MNVAYKQEFIEFISFDKSEIVQVSLAKWDKWENLTSKIPKFKLMLIAFESIPTKIISILILEKVL